MSICGEEPFALVAARPRCAYCMDWPFVNSQGWRRLDLTRDGEDFPIVLWTGSLRLDWTRGLPCRLACWQRLPGMGEQRAWNLLTRKWCEHVNLRL